jgi:hypothetical protein
MDWKKEVKSWGAILAVFAFLYFTGLIPVIQGALQSVLLATGLMKPSIEVPDITDQNFDYRGQFTDFKGNTIDLQSYRGKTLLSTYGLLGVVLAAQRCPIFPISTMR